jgi:pullulanase
MNKKLALLVVFFFSEALHAQTGAAQTDIVQGDSKSIGDCNIENVQTILHPAASTHDARAYWLNKHYVKWPNAKKSGKFFLYYSKNGKIEGNIGSKVIGADGSLALDILKDNRVLPSHITSRFKFVPNGVLLKIKEADLPRLHDLHKQQVVLVQENKKGEVLDVTALQVAGAFDELYASAKQIEDFGVTVKDDHTSFKLWAPSAQKVGLCVYEKNDHEKNSHENNSHENNTNVDAMEWNVATGTWSLTKPTDLTGRYYQYIVDVFVRGVGIVRNRVTDPYSISLTTDSKRSYISSLNAPALLPAGWQTATTPNKLNSAADLVVYELHVRDFSINDKTVSASNRGKYLAFTEKNSNGMKHLSALAKAGITDIHLLPVFDFATVPEKDCITPEIKNDAANSESQQQVVSAVASKDCFNWGYDPYHFNAPEGSYSTNPVDGAIHILELRKMIIALHNAGLRVGMDVVYNHMFASGQNEKSVLDRLVPGYYHRLNEKGDIEHSTCCENTATENLMMGKLLVDSVVLWATAYKMDSFRFDLMAHQPRALMEELQTTLNIKTGRDIQLLGEGWNFGEVASGTRFVQASQLSLNGTGIGTFSDRARDAVRGGSAMDSGESLVKRKGYINGLANSDEPSINLQKTADLVRVGLAGSVRDYQMLAYDGTQKLLKDIDYNGQPAGYASQPSEVVNYVENHDNQTLFDLNVYKLSANTTSEDRVYVQMLGVAVTAFSQGIAYYHAGVDVLRSKSMDRDSYNSGDWFNRLDWTYQDNYFGTGMPTKERNDNNYTLIQSVLTNSQIKLTTSSIILARDMFRDLLKMRASSTLFRLKTTEEIQQRLHFYNTGVNQNTAVIVAKLDGDGYAGASCKSLVYLINVAVTAQTVRVPALRELGYKLHSVHSAADAADKRILSSAIYSNVVGDFTIPARSAVVFVEL